MPAVRVKIQPAIVSGVVVDADWLTMRCAPTATSVRLAAATQAQRNRWTLEAMGTAVHWPDVDEDIGVWTLLGVPEDLVLEAAGFREPD